ncbi:unnamed protein product [Calypogeia fissa]
MLLHFRDPARLKTRRVQFEDTYYARDSGTLEQLKQLSSSRKAIEESINGSSHLTPAIAREMAGGITSPILQDLLKLERYIPLLENLVVCVEKVKQLKPAVIQWTIDLKFRWTSPLTRPSVTGLSGPKIFRVDDLRYELGMSLFLYAALLRERALEVLPTDMTESATYFRRASGVYQHMAQEVLLPLASSLPPDRPPEATMSMATIMSIVSLAEAQAVTVRKAEEKGASGSLLAKLHYGVVQFLGDALLLLRTQIGDWNDIPEKFRKYLTICSVLHEARSQRYIAEDYRKAEKLGVAVGILRHATSRVKQVRTPNEDGWKDVFRQEVDALAHLLRRCEQENEYIWREKAYRLDELPILEGKKIVAPILYQAFGLDRDFIFVA